MKEIDAEEQKHRVEQHAHGTTDSAMWMRNSDTVFLKESRGRLVLFEVCILQDGLRALLKRTYNYLPGKMTSFTQQSPLPFAYSCCYLLPATCTCLQLF